MNNGVTHDVAARHETPADLSEAFSISCPESMWPHVRKVLEGEYDIPGLEFADPPHVIDVGANVGAFAIWASERWPGARIRCYEPNPEAFERLKQNVPIDDDEALQCVAVRHARERAPLHLGVNNLGEASFHDLGEQRPEHVVVDCIAARMLPPCDVLKLDVEGDEGVILLNYTLRPKAIVLEFHSAALRREIDAILTERHYELVRARIDRTDRGVVCYVHTGPEEERAR